jgi:hypothetical protein
MTTSYAGPQNQAEKALTDAIQSCRLKANLFTLKFRFEEAEKAYETQLGYINRESNPQLWAETEVDVGITHAELGIRVEGKAGKGKRTPGCRCHRLPKCVGGQDARAATAGLGHDPE